MKVIHKINGLINGLRPDIGVIAAYVDDKTIQSQFFKSAFESASYLLAIQDKKDIKYINRWNFKDFNKFADVMGEVLVEEDDISVAINDISISSDVARLA